MLRARSLKTQTLALALACCSAACSSGSKADSSANETPDAATPTSGVGCADAGADTYAAGLQKSGSEGHYGFELVSSTPAPPALNDNTFVMQVKDAEGKPVAGELSVVLEMPEHGHRSQQPVITFDADAQTFTLDPMRLFMVGLWRLTFGFQPGAAAAKTAPDPDSAVFEFCLD